MSFGAYWSMAWADIFGEKSEGVPWCQVTLRTDGGDSHSHALWSPRVVRLIDSSIPAHQRASSAWYEGQQRKGIHHTAEMLWEVRGDKTKEGLVLCHGLLHVLNGSSRSPRNSSLLDLMRGLENLPPLPAEIHWPWHHWCSDTFPSNVSSLCDDLVRQAVPRSMRGVPSETRDRECTHWICQMAVADFAVSLVRHKLVRLDVLRSGQLRDLEDHPIYENAVQLGDEA